MSKCVSKRSVGLNCAVIQREKPVFELSVFKKFGFGWQFLYYSKYLPNRSDVVRNDYYQAIKLSLDDF